MESTPYSESNQSFSNRAHAVAQDQIYTKLFSCERSKLRFEDVSVSTGVRGKALDGEMGVDRIIYLKSELFPRGEICHTVQERFRRPKYASRRDLTITEWSVRPSIPTELYKINAGVFVYGYFDEGASTMLSWVAADTTRMLTLLASGAICFSHEYNPRSDQYFITIKFNELWKRGCVLAIYDHDTSDEWSVTK
jgi:hypothetical protein